MIEKTLVLLSGGLDSSVALAKITRRGPAVAVFFNRGQSNFSSERTAVQKVTALLKCHLREIDITSWWQATDGKIPMIDVPRNAIFALLASPFAAIEECGLIAIGSTRDDANTGDSNKEFVLAFNQLRSVMKLDRMPRLTAPFLDLGWGKAEVVKWARSELNDSFIESTHSCWKEVPCKTCPACIARANALKAA